MSNITLYLYTRIYPFSCFWTFGLFLVLEGSVSLFAFGFGKYEYSCYEDSYTSLCVDIHFYFFWVKYLGVKFLVIG